MQRGMPDSEALRERLSSLQVFWWTGKDVEGSRDKEEGKKNMKKKYEVAFFLCFVFVGGLMLIVGQVLMWRGTTVEWKDTSWFSGHWVARYTSEFYSGQWLFFFGFIVAGFGAIGALAIGSSRLMDKIRGEKA
jgi:hypothetical protein